VRNFAENKMITLEIPIPLTNNNDGQSRHWSKANQHKQTFAKTLAIMRMKATPPERKQRVTITRILGKGQSLWDADSVLRGNAKQLLDSLVEPFNTRLALKTFPPDEPRITGGTSFSKLSV